MINNESRMAQTFWETGKLPCPILDFHGHVHQNAAIHFAAEHPEGMMKTMDETGIRWLLQCSNYALYDSFEGEQFNIEVSRQYPNRIKSYRGIISRTMDPDQAIRDVEDMPDVYVGFKFLPSYYNTYFSDDRHTPLFEYLNETKKICLVHTYGIHDYNDAKQMLKVAEKYPDATFLCGHTFLEEISASLEMLKHLPNLYYELTAINLFNGYLENIVERVGSEKILFGTDLPWYSTSYNIGSILEARVTDEDRENIFWRNGDKLLREKYDWYTL